MKLPFLSFFEKKIPTEYFLALLFRDEKIHAVVFEQINGRIQVIGEGKSTITTSPERASDEMLLEAADKAISIAEQSLPNNITTHKTVFGVKETWVEDTHISKDYLTRLKTISDQLDLKPIGFLVFPEAIAHLLQKEEGAPVSAILIEAGAHQVTITLIRAGRIVGTKEVATSDNITETVEEALKQFENIEIFPSRIILFDGGDKDAEKKFLQHKWSKSLPFLHVPQITTLPHDFDTRAILFGTATQMGLDAIDVIKLPIKKAEADFEPSKESDFAEKQDEKEMQEEAPVEVVAEKKDSHAKAEDSEKAAEKNEDVLEEVSGKDTSEYFGFVKDTDIAQNAPNNPHASPLRSSDVEEVTEDILENEKEEELAGSAPGFSTYGPIFVEGAKKTYHQVRRFLPKQFSLQPIVSLLAGFSRNAPNGKSKMLLFIPVGVVILLVILLWYIFGLHAKVTLFLTPKTISQDQTITFVTNGQSDPSKNTIGVQSVSISEDGKVSGDATGTKDIGNPAKGTVTLFNSDNDSHTLSKGTTITSSNGLKFTLDKDVTVASGSSDPTNLTAGTADVSITASDIGTDSNLPSNTKFTISGTSVLAAKNASALSGGTKQSITVVSQKDLDNLSGQLTDNLKDKAKSDLTAKINGDEVVLPDFVSTTLSNTDFDKKVGDQSKSINLSATVTYQTIAYKKSDIDGYAKAALSGKLPTDLTLSSDGISYSVKDLSTKDGTTKATLTMKASLIPTIDTNTLKGQIAGKSFTEAKDILSGVPQFSDTTIALSPNLFFLPQTLPRMSRNISFTIVAHE